MPFLDQITSFVNDTLKASSLNNSKLQPTQLYGISSIVARPVKPGSTDLEILPAIVKGDTSVTLLTPDSKTAFQMYHKANNNTYSKQTKPSGFGDDYDLQVVTELQLIIFCNTKLSGFTKENLETILVFNMPQRLPAATISELGIKNCQILVVSSNTNPQQIFNQEFPKSKYFLTEGITMFSINYRVTLTYDQSCVAKCACS